VTATATATAPAVEPARAVIGGRLAGSWYPKGEVQARQALTGYFEAAVGAPPDAVAALIVPHAGWRFSGATAAHAYKTVFGASYDRVILLAPSHKVALGGQAVVTDAAGYATPLGEVSLDRDGAALLLKNARFRLDNGVVGDEHAIEVQMPFLRLAVPEAPVLPVVLGHLPLDAARETAAQLRALVGERTLVVVSSDFTHYGPQYGYQPFADDVEANLGKLDLRAASFLERKDAGGFARFLDETGDTICGAAPILVLLQMLSEGLAPRLLRYDTSGALLGDFTNSVSYLAFAIVGRWSATAPAFDPQRWPLAYLSPEQKKTLLVLARRTIEHFLAEGKRLDPTLAGIVVDDVLRERAGAFVTLEKNGILRGCIGEIPPRRPLVDVVIDHAIDAAVHDSRFRPVEASELPELEIEVSILTPPQAVASYTDIRIGTDGVVLDKGGRRAVFLPQVAPEQGWSLPEMLNHLAQKAGLPTDAWKEGARFEVFQAIVFAEHE
jgi:AmmeMemoRadiSam system protein B/AmmeMemoRadiSam system protein A